MIHSLPVLRLALDRRATAFVIALLLALAAAPAMAALHSDSSSFGPDTITYDSVSGLRWLDLTLTTNRSYADTLTALASGDLVAYRYATAAEVTALWQHAGIDTSQNDFVPQNYAPIVALAGLLGGAIPNYLGNCGAGCSFTFTQGWVESGPMPVSVTSAGLSWFDNSAALTASYPAAPVGRALFSGGPDVTAAYMGSWLVAVPEPPAQAPAAALTLGALALSRSARSGRRPRRARRP